MASGNGGSDPNPSVTWNGTSMTKVSAVQSGGYGVGLFYLTSPATGTHNIVISVTGNNDNFGGGISFKGASLTQNGATNSNTSTNGQLSVTTTKAGSYLVDAIVLPSQITPTVASSQTAIYSGNQGNIGTGGGGSYISTPTAQSNATNWNASNVAREHLAMEVLAGAATGNFFQFF